VNACDRFIGRLYDEDARRALEAGRAAPEDLRAHAGGCVDCRRAWADARADMCLLPSSLLEVAPPSLKRRAARAMRAGLLARDAPLIDWMPAATWAATAAALAACGLVVIGPSLPLLWQSAAVLAAAAAALSAEVTRQGLAGSSA
jgi:hypothetical protein